MQYVIQTLMRRIKLLASRGVLKKIDDSSPMQQVQVSLLAGELRDTVRVQNYGLSSVPLSEAIALALALNGSRGQSVVIAAENPEHRPTELKEGEVCLYTHEGDRIHLKQGRIIAIEAGAAVQVSAPEITLTGATTVNGDTVFNGNVQVNGEVNSTGDINSDATITAAADVQAAGTSLVGHAHTSAAPGNPTSPPM